MSDITDIMNRDPLQLTDQDIDKVIAWMREQRNQFNLGGAKTTKSKPHVDVKLDDINL